MVFLKEILFRKVKHESTTLEFANIYKPKTDKAHVQMNPMLNPEDMRNHKDNTADVQAEVMELKSKNANLEFENKSMKEENSSTAAKITGPGIPDGGTKDK